MSEEPSRRAVLQAVAAASPLAAGGLGSSAALSTMIDKAPAGSQAQQQASVTGTVRDVRGDPLPDMRVAAVYLAPGARRTGVTRKCYQSKAVIRGEIDERNSGDPTFVDEPFVLGTDRTASNGEFELPGAPDRAAGRIIIAARGQPSGAADTWFGMEQFAVAAYRQMDSIEVTVNNRVLLADRAFRTDPLGEPSADADRTAWPYGQVLVWDEIDPSPGAEYRHTVYVETSGDQFRPPTENDFGESGAGAGDDRAVDREDYVSQVDAGLTTLQLPEDVAVGYEVGNGDPRDPPEGLWTNEAQDSPATICETTRLSLGFTSRTEAGLLPTYPALAETGDQHFLPYADGRQERLQRDREDLILSVVSLLVSIVGTITGGGVAAAVLFSIMGLSVGALESSDPSELPGWSVEDRETFGEGSLEPDFDQYDFVPSQWQFDTFSFVQPYPLQFTEDVSKAFCVRGLYRLNLPDAGGEGDESTKRVFQLQHRFDIDPAAVSPLDDAAAVAPESDSTSPAPPVPTIEVTDRTPTVGEEVELRADVASFPRPDGVEPNIESYEWEILPPNVERNNYVDVTGDGAAEQLTQNDYREARTTATGASVTPEVRLPGEYYVTLTVVDDQGRARRTSTYLSVQEPAPVEIHPVATDSGDECYYPPTGERQPATGPDAAHHVGYGCGEWKIYPVAPGETYTIAFTVDDCHGCVLSDATHVIEEPTVDPEGRFESVSWTEARQWTDSLGEAGAGEVHEYSFVPSTDYIRVRNVDGNSGLGFYVSLYGPRPGGL